MLVFYRKQMKMTYMTEPGNEKFWRPKMALATKKKFPVAKWRPKIGTGDQKQISSSQLANKKIFQRRAL